jgi:class 3 adenylate cyclase
MTAAKYRYNSLEDFLISVPLTVDGQLNDGWDAMFPVKGKEIEATILFADISSFSSRTLKLKPTETLIFVNHFFTWITAEALREGHGIVDKYIGDEIMIIFSKEFGSEDPFLEAVRTARWIGERDLLRFMPHIGIASGLVTIGYVCTPLKYNCSVFGAPVALAARCASLKKEDDPDPVFAGIAFPAEEWRNRDFDTVFPRRKYENDDGTVFVQQQFWEILQPEVRSLKNIGDYNIQYILNRVMHASPISAEELAREFLRGLYETGRYWPASE